MKFYLSSRYGRIHEMQAMAAWLRNQGHTVTSTWLDGDESLDTDTPSHDVAREWAFADIEDIRAADCLVAFTEQPQSPWSRGGRHVELGYAMGMGKSTVVVGPLENIFCHVTHLWCETGGGFMDWVRDEARYEDI